MDYPELQERKLVLFWILGSIAILWGAWIVGHLERTTGVTSLSYYSSLLIAFLLVLFGGLAWIAVGVSVIHH